MNEYVSGNTIWLTCEFESDPQMVKLVVYDYKNNKIAEFLDVTRLSAGKYQYGYTTSPTQKGLFYYEWYGETDGKPCLDRRGFKVNFVKGGN